jgi:hypothetical protein
VDWLSGCAGGDVVTGCLDVLGRADDGVSSPKDAKKSKSRSKSKSRKEKKERKDKKDKKSKKDKKGKKDKKERKGKKDKKDRRGRRGDGSDADIDPDVADFRASRGMAPRGVPASAAAAAGDVDAGTEAIAKGAKAKEILASREYKEAQQQLHNKRQGPGDLGSGSFHDMCVRCDVAFRRRFSHGVVSVSRCLAASMRRCLLLPVAACCCLVACRL